MEMVLVKFIEDGSYVTTWVDSAWLGFKAGYESAKTDIKS